MADNLTHVGPKAGFPGGHALVIAIAAYQHINPLPQIVLNDANDVAGILISPDHCGYDPANVTLLLNGAATRAKVLVELEALANRTSNEDTACVYFSGHGALMGGHEAAESSLLTVDCNASDFSASTISAAEFSKALHRIKAKRLIIFLDACHAGGAATLKNSTSVDGLPLGFSEKTLDRLAEGTGRTLMASSRSSETSLILGGARNSVFTTYLLKGLGGAADNHGEGLIKVFDLFEYIAKEVSVATSGRQHPNFKASQLEQNFPIALSRGGVKNFITPSAIAVPDNNAWQILGRALSDLYPAGPSDQEIWVRAGGDLSRLRLQGSGHANWFSALKVLQHGGGGAGISVESLVNTVRADYPNHPELVMFYSTYGRA